MRRRQRLVLLDDGGIVIRRSRLVASGRPHVSVHEVQTGNVQYWEVHEDGRLIAAWTDLGIALEIALRREVRDR